MEEISFELNLLKKSFPFILFTFTKPVDNVRIWINDEYDKVINNIIRGDSYNFWYNPILSSDKWKITRTNGFNTIKEFLDQFIWGLINFKYY